MEKLAKSHWYYFILVFTICLASCQPAVNNTTIQPPAQTTSTVSSEVYTPAFVETGTPNGNMTSTQQIENQPTSTPGPEDWKSLPIIPSISKRTIEIYLNGLALGNNPHAFMKIGDCEAIASWFLVDFDGASKNYSLGNFTNLTDVILYFQGSYARTSLAAARGFNTASALSTLWADPKLCLKGENPIQCEYRVWKPSFALVLLGTNDDSRPEKFEGRMRIIIEYLITNGVVPVLSTKADNMEGNNAFNQTLARLATEYDIPLWNFWLAAQPLPRHGLQDDKEHLTWAPNDFGDPAVMKYAWPVRNLTALQMLDALRKAVLDAGGGR